MKLLLLALVAASGCAAVKPWQRELLATPGMTVRADSNSDAEQHMLESREASLGGFGASGGGCGCN
jgi:hypothetical protein